jgi:hypothetical protein
MSIKDINWTVKQAPENGPMPGVAGLVVGGNPSEFLEGEALGTTPTSNDKPADGSNPSMPTSLPLFGNGPDVIRRK